MRLTRLVIVPAAAGALVLVGMSAASAGEVTGNGNGPIAAFVDALASVGYDVRVLDYTGSTSTIGLARWLDRNVIALAMTEGSGTALDEVQYAMRRARWATDRPIPEPATLPSPERVEAAKLESLDMRVTASQVEYLMVNLGHPPLKAATVRKWAERETIQQGEDGMYRLGDILDRNPQRPAVSDDTVSHGHMVS